MVVFLGMSIFLSLSSGLFALSRTPARFSSSGLIRSMAVTAAVVAALAGITPLVYDSLGSHSTAVRIAYLLGGATLVVFLVLCARILSGVTPDEFRRSVEGTTFSGMAGSPESAATSAHLVAIVLQIIAVAVVPLAIWLALSRA